MPNASSSIRTKSIGRSQKPAHTALRGLKRGDSGVAAYERLRQLIVRGQIAPGSSVVEAELAESLKVSRTPIRAALQLLEREGFITEQKTGVKSRMRVAPLTRRISGELHLILGTLEGLGAAGAASLPHPDREEVCAFLREINNRLQNLANSSKEEWDAIFELDTLFHAKFVASGSGEKLISLHEISTPQIERYWRLYPQSMTTNLPIYIREHEEIIQGIESGDAIRAEKAIKRVWKESAKRVDSLIVLHGERGIW